MTRSRVCPGERSTRTECEPIGYHPEAIEPADRPARGTAASARLLYGPTNVSRSVSNPSALAFTAKTATWLRRSRYSVRW